MGSSERRLGRFTGLDDPVGSEETVMTPAGLDDPDRLDGVVGVELDLADLGDVVAVMLTGQRGEDPDVIPDRDQSPFEHPGHVPGRSMDGGHVIDHITCIGIYPVKLYSSVIDFSESARLTYK